MEVTSELYLIRKRKIFKRERRKRQEAKERIVMPWRRYHYDSFASLFADTISGMDVCNGSSQLYEFHVLSDRVSDACCHRFLQPSGIVHRYLDFEKRICSEMHLFFSDKLLFVGAVMPIAPSGAVIQDRQHGRQRARSCTQASPMGTWERKPNRSLNGCFWKIGPITQKRTFL